MSYLDEMYERSINMPPEPMLGGPYDPEEEGLIVPLKGYTCPWCYCSLVYVDDIDRYICENEDCDAFDINYEFSADELKHFD